MDSSRSLTAMLAATPAFGAMGEGVEKIRQELIAWGRELERSVDPAYASSVAEALRFLETQSCRIAVIGQVKAGKSSFISALVGRPSLLPSDVNPWTTVVTNLHFYSSPTHAESAMFTLFDGNEWTRIADSGGTLRELTERLVPGFDPDLLRSQLRSMRARAEQRLGPNFHAMLGQQHTYPTITPDLLARYVSAGPDGSDGEAVEGWYSDITKTADLYFGNDRSGFPVTLVDTPGTNDPLLVRDEITRLSLASADIYVVVLTAQQPLSIGDLALLRLLRGLHKERIVIFINRIDALRDIVSGSSRLIEHVESRLNEEFPGVRFPIVAGSARWANSALASQPAEMIRVMDPSFLHYAANKGFADLEPASGDRRPPGATISALLSLSGIPEVIDAVSTLLGQGNAAHAIEQLATFFREVARSGEATGRAQLRSVERAIGETRVGAESRDRELDVWKQELDQLEQVGTQLQANLGVYEESLRSLVERCGSDLRLLLGRSIGRFTDRQTAEMARTYRERSSKVWSCNSTPLRDELQHEFIRIYQYWESQLTRADTLIRAQLRSIMPESSLHGAESPLDGAGISAVRYPDVSALGRVVALDLASPWWIAWWKGRPSLESRSAELARLIASEFEPLIDDLANAAMAALGEHSAHAARQARMGTLDIVNSIRHRSAELIAQLQQSGGNPGSEALAHLEYQRQQAEALVERWANLRAGLSNLVAKCESTLQHQVPAKP